MIRKLYPRFWKKIAGYFLYVLYLVIVTGILLELAYRFQVIEFYRTELNAMNSEEDLKGARGRKTILIWGDSFSVQSNNYGDLIRKRLIRDFRTVNSAITGSSIIEASHVVPKRIEAFDPDIFICQLYVGNDLLGITHPLNWEKSSWVKNIYWCISEKFHVLSFINYKLGQLRWHVASGGVNIAPSADKFIPEYYRTREKSYAHAEPYLINNSVLLKNGREKDFHYMAESLKEILNELKPGCKTYLVVIPHKSQVNRQYMEHMRAIGFSFEDGFYTNMNYPFVQQLRKRFEGNPEIEVLDPLQTFREISDSIPLYYFNDEHLNEVGQSVLSEFILTEL